VINYVGFEGYVGVLCRSEKKKGRKIKSKREREKRLNKGGTVLYSKLIIIILSGI
jgi:hypothetical protein